MTTLNKEQSLAVEMAVNAARSRNKICVLSGPAGTGKTFTLKEICSLLPDSIVLAPTGRAALRVTELTGREASTIHRWMYRPLLDPKTGAIIRFTRRMTDEIIFPKSGLLIIDESSMLQRDTWNDIQKLAREAGFSILLVGDSFQLPPVSKEDEEPFSVFYDTFICDSRVDLIEVFRQALDSPIIRAATLIRQSTDWSPVKDVLSDFVADSAAPVKDAASNLVHRSSLGEDITIISYTNAVRHDVNRKARIESSIDPDGDPLDGEPLLVRRNCYPAGVFNGQIVDFGGFERDFMVKNFRFGVAPINGVYCSISMSELLGGSPPSFDYVRGLREPYVSANLGYCLTCHASQGSEWDNVLIMFEKKLLTTMSIKDRIRWTYTAFTRARKNATLYVVNN